MAFGNFAPRLEATGASDEGYEEITPDQIKNGQSLSVYIGPNSREPMKLAPHTGVVDNFSVQNLANGKKHYKFTLATWPEPMMRFDELIEFDYPPDLTTIVRITRPKQQKGS